MEGGGPSIIGINAESRARELRRRVGNRRRAGADVLSSPLPALTLSLPQLVYAKHEAHEIRMDLIDAQSQHNSVLKYCDQQFVIESNVRQLRKGIGETQLQIRQKTEELDELQRRVLRLSKALHDSSDEKTFAKTKLGSQEEIRKHQLHTKSCRHCGRQYLPGIAKSHEDNCTGVSLPDLQPMNQIADSLELQSQNSLSLPTIKKTPDAPVATRFVSQPPRNLRLNLKEITHNALAIVWDPPIFTGSNAILDYELSYAVVHSKTKQQRQFDPQPPLRLSQWCLVNPIPGDNYRLTNLSADQEYGEFALCVITVAGKSEPSNKVEIIRTQPSIPPTTPLFLCVGVVSATSITLTWVEPLDDGGRSVQDYEVIFSEAIINLDNVDNRGKAWLNVSEIEYRPRRIRTNSTRTSLTITNLLSGGEHLNFQVRAVNSEGVQGDYCEPIKSIFTIAPGNEFKLLDELQAAVNSRSRTVDSQFLSGFMQRYERNHYIQQVSRIILSMHPELETKQPQAIQQATGQKQFDDLTDEEKVCERRRQFHFRVAAIRNDLKKADYNVQWCKDRQIDLVALIRSAESRILEKQAELERARMFKGPQMDSDVFENGLQRFFTKELIVALEDEVEIDQLYILDTKSEIVLVENYLRADIKHRDTLLKSIGLLNAALGRDDLMIETQKLLHELRSTGTSLQDIRWTTEQQLASKTEKPLAECNADLEQAREQNKKYFYFLLEGDAKGNLQDYESALRLYNFVLGNDLWMQQMTEAQRVQLQLKIGEATFRLENHEQALTIFNRASIMANRAGLRRERIQRKLDIREETKLISSLEILLSEKKALLAKGEDDLKRALASDSTQVDSTVISGSNARYDVEDFKKKLAKLLGGVRAGQEQVNKDIANAKIRISNAEDEIKAWKRNWQEKLRCFRFNATNEALKNVVGAASHGITTCVASAGVNGLLFDFLSGACLAQAVGDPEKNHLGEPTGHQAQILCVYYIGHRIYTGSADASLGVWDVKNESIGGFSCSLTRMLMDFDAAVVSVVADTQWFACGCSDCDVFVFDAESLATIAHIISAHDRTVTTLSIQSAKSALTTGAGDNKIKVWELGKASQFTARRNFDATRIISGASNGQICVIDFATGHLIQTMYGHQDGILDLQCDRTRLISMSADGKVRLWFWQTRDGVGADRKKYHIVGAGETLRSLSLMYLEVDTNVSASDELKTLDLSSSVQFGKLSYENLDFVASNQTKSKDVEAQWAAQRLALLAKEYFPSLDDKEANDDKEKAVEVADEEGESDSEDMALDENDDADEATIEE
ncbi:hypothetical protein PInf_025368 [Phytophthora infestans]|nr:hypothetical protein PInf_025368 [Phytophthora infestans]